MRRRQQPEAFRLDIPNVAPGLTESTSAASLPALAEYFTPAEVSQKLKISTKQVIRLFEGRASVLNLGGTPKPTREELHECRVRDAQDEVFAAACPSSEHQV
jgi:hypothetical protein